MTHISWLINSAKCELKSPVSPFIQFLAQVNARLFYLMKI